MEVCSRCAGELLQAVLGEPSKVVCLRFGQDFSPECMKMDEAFKSRFFAQTKN